MDAPGHTVTAEELGYRRAWFYDSPALYADVWMVLALAADRTRSIGLGPAVLVPSLRHPMVTAAAIATLAAQAPGRVAVAVGAGFTGRMVLGERPMPWIEVASYIRVLHALLRGEAIEWDGHLLRMLHPDGFGASRPVDIPILVGADGPKGMAVAEELGDGVFSAMVPVTCDHRWRPLLTMGTVLDDGEDPGSERAIRAVGPALAVVYHGTYLRGGADAVDSLPGGREWREATEAVPERERHLAVHEGHLVEANPRDLPAVRAGASLIPDLTLTGTAAEVRQKIEALADLGITEVAFQPGGPDIPGELERFASRNGGAVLARRVAPGRESEPEEPGAHPSRPVRDGTETNGGGAAEEPPARLVGSEEQAPEEDQHRAEDDQGPQVRAGEGEGVTRLRSRRRRRRGHRVGGGGCGERQLRGRCGGG